MKKTIVSQFIMGILLITTSYGQTEKGGFLLGGNASASWSSVRSNTSFQLNFNPQIGYFIKKNLALGVSIPANYYKNGDITSFNYGLSPFARYYFAKTEHSSLFASANIGILFNHTEQKNFPLSSTTSTTLITKNTDKVAGIGLGYTYFLNENIGMETEVKYDFTKNNNYNKSGLGLNVGFQIYFNKPKK